MTSSELSQQARALAGRKYVTVIAYEPEENGTPDYLAMHPEMPDCIAQGETVDAARNALASATELWIRCLLEDGLPVPDPIVLGGRIDVPIREAGEDVPPNITPIGGTMQLQPA